MADSMTDWMTDCMTDLMVDWVADWMAGLLFYFLSVWGLALESLMNVSSNSLIFGTQKDVFSRRIEYAKHWPN